ncbi:hypothetical protein Taro_056614 [Colocasia esculenta]|uniref:Transcription initiation factor TFIID subunit 9 n=1 Tax=Colocasia esculenta TaxID=4460 RepID=A0A843XTZ0_COLES|nr:hypothetical protein [Colocasia esculenta]
MEGDGGAAGTSEKAAMEGGAGSAAAPLGGGAGREDGSMGEELAGGEGPRDARIVRALLRSMGVAEYEPRVVHQFLELWYRYVVDVLADAQVYSEHAGKPAIDPDDVKLAIQSKVNFSFSQPPPREVLLELARSRNKIPLPKSISTLGIPLPPEQDTLINPNYQLLIPKKPSAAESEGPEEEDDAPSNPESIRSPANATTVAGTPKSTQESNAGGAGDLHVAPQQLTPQRVSFPLAAGKRPR